MKFTLDRFEQRIDPSILSRGISYFERGYVRELTETAPGTYKAQVEGSHLYKVQIKIENNVVTHHHCDCPYQHSPICKHKTAVLLHLTQQKSKVKLPITTDLVPKSLAQQIDLILNKTDLPDLQRFLTKAVKEDKNMRQVFLSTFAHLNDNEDKSTYANQIKKQLKAVSYYGIIEWFDVKKVEKEIQKLLQNAQKHLDNEHYQSAIFIALAVVEELEKILYQIHDHHHIFESCIAEALELLQTLYKIQLPIEIESFFFQQCILHLSENIFSEREWHIQLFKLASQLLSTTDEMKLLFEQIELIQNGYILNEVILLKYDILKQFQLDFQADNFLMEFLHIPNVRQRAIEQFISRQELEMAKIIAFEGIEQHKNDRKSLVINWKICLLKIALTDQHQSDIIKYSRYLYIEDFNGEINYYQLLKEHVKSSEWDSFFEKLVNEIIKIDKWTSHHQLVQLFKSEQKWEQLFDTLNASNDFRIFKEYEAVFPKEFISKIVNTYANELVDFVQKQATRAAYRDACHYIQRIHQLGFFDKAMALITHLQEKFPKRRALIEELNLISAHLNPTYTFVPNTGQVA